MSEVPKKEEEKKASEPQKETDELDDKEAKQDPTAENEIRVAAKGQIKNYLGYAFRILNKTNHKSLKIRATGNAIVKANILIELVKRRVGDLHQLNSIYSMVIKSTESKNPIGETTEMRRRVTAMDTLLSKEPLDENDPGYQKPEPKEEPYQSRQPRKNKDREPKEDGGDKRGGKGKQQKGHKKTYNDLPAGDDDKDNDKKDGKKKDDRKKEPAKKDNKDKDDKKGRRTRKEKINANVKDDEMDRSGKKKDKRRGKDGRQMMPPDMYPYPPRGMMGPRGGYPMYPMEQRGDRPRDPRAMPPYMGYPVRSYDDFNVRPRGGKGKIRGHPGVDPRQGMYYPPYYDPYMMYQEYGPRRYNDGPPPKRYNDEGPQRQYNGPQGGGQQMYNEQPSRGQRMPDKDVRRDGPPMQQRGPPNDKPEKRDGPPREYNDRPRGGQRYNDEPPRDRDNDRRRGGGDFNPERGGTFRGRGAPRQFNPDGPPRGARGGEGGPDFDRSRFGEGIRGNRGGMIHRGSRGSMRGGRGGGDRPERDQQDREGEGNFSKNPRPFQPTNARTERGGGEVNRATVHQRAPRGGGSFRGGPPGGDGNN